MDWLLSSIEEWIKDGLIETIIRIYQDLFTSINEKVGGITLDVGQSPLDWNPGVFQMIRNLSITVVNPIAGMILTFVLTYELINMVIDKNNMHNSDTFEIFKWILKAFCSVYILTHSFDIIIGVFGLAQNVVNQSAGLAADTLALQSDIAVDTLRASLEASSVWDLLFLSLEMNIVWLTLYAISIVIFIIIYGRMLEVYCVVSVAPIPLSTMANHEWSQIGANYLKALFALAFQAFLIMICVIIYAVLINTIPMTDNLHIAVWSRLGCSALLCRALFSTGSLSKSLFGAR
ncbi:MAG: hypothetical protein LBB94_12010 [Clostridiales bacterium]|jgi:hypothetical protein|nr:hypothetical protein [Clostridiales bacterium]